MKPITFFRIARSASGNDIARGVISAPGERNDVILSEASFVALAAICAAVVVAFLNCDPLSVSQISNGGVINASAAFAMMLCDYMWVSAFPFSNLCVGFGAIFLIPAAMVGGVLCSLFWGHALATKFVDAVSIQRVAFTSQFQNAALICFAILRRASQDFVSVDFVMRLALFRNYCRVSFASKPLCGSVSATSFAQITLSPLARVRARFISVGKLPSLPFFAPALFADRIQPIAALIDKEELAGCGKALIASLTSAHLGEQ